MSTRILARSAASYRRNVSRRRADESELSRASRQQRRRRSPSLAICDARACSKEVGLLSELRGRVAVPGVLYVGPSTETVPFLVLEFVDGISMRELKQSGDVRGIAEAAARSRAEPGHARVGPSASDAAVLATHFEPDPGATSRSERQCSSHRPLSRVAAAARAAGGAARDACTRLSHGATMTMRSRRCRRVWASRMAISNSANILVRRCAGRWTVAAILDWEFAFEGSVAYDIGNFPAIRATSNLAL